MALPTIVFLLVLEVGGITLGSDIPYFFSMFLRLEAAALVAIFKYFATADGDPSLFQASINSSSLVRFDIIHL